MGGLLHLVQRRGDWAGPQPAHTSDGRLKTNFFFSSFALVFSLIFSGKQIELIAPHLHVSLCVLLLCRILSYQLSRNLKRTRLEQPFALLLVDSKINEIVL